MQEQCIKMQQKKTKNKNKDVEGEKMQTQEIMMVIYKEADKGKKQMKDMMTMHSRKYR